MVIKLNSQGIPEGNPISDSNFRALFTEHRIGPALTPYITEPLGYGMYSFSVPPTLTVEQKYKKLVEGSPLKNEETGFWIQQWNVVDQTAEEITETDNKQALKIRNARKAKLAECDWTDLPNAPLTSEKKTEWINYRQSLRDITLQQGFPWEINWPNQPL